MHNIDNPKRLDLTEGQSQMLVDSLVGLNNSLVAIMPAHLSPVLGYEAEFGQVRATAAVAAVLDFMRSVNITPEAREPLLQLHAALCDAAEGRKNLVTAPAKQRPGTPKKLIMDQLDDGMAAAAVDILVLDRAAPINVERALAEIANAFGYSRKSLAAIRKNLRAPDAGSRSPKASAQAVAQYRYWIDRKNASNMTGRSFVDALIDTRGFKGQKR